jgi:UDP-N-acetylmuramate--alanine ligase
MTKIPFTIGKFHIIGIGGIGMSGIAEVLHNLGYQVQGSDVADGYNIKRLRDLGITVHIGHQAENINGANVVVVSSAIKKDNPEIMAARKQMLPVVKRAEMLAEIMRLKWSVAVSGTHGKTTTTSLVAHLLEMAGKDPTVINGGIINALGSNTRLGAGEWMVVEADESDGTFVKLPTTIAVVTNIDPEHLDHFGNFTNAQAAYVSFVQNVPFYGFAMLCIDHPVVQSLIAKASDRKIITYGISPQADIRATNVTYDDTGCRYDVTFSARLSGGARTIKGFHLPLVGAHNVQNSLAAIGIANEMGIADTMLRSGLGNFAGVKRRFTKTGVVNGITIIDDYGHHPVEIAAVLRAARNVTKGQVIAVVQPHRYSRVNNLFEDFCRCFNDADAVIVAPIYAAGEEPIPGITRDTLVQGMMERGHNRALALPGPADLARVVADIAKPGDYVICLGAGDITTWAYALPNELGAVLGASAVGKVG